MILGTGVDGQVEMLTVTVELTKSAKTNAVSGRKEAW